LIRDGTDDGDPAGPGGLGRDGGPATRGRRL